MDKLFIKGIVSKIAENKYQVIASTATIDRQGDSIDQSGWDLANYMKNPVMLWAHDYTELPVAKCTSISKETGQLKMEFEFAPAEGNPKAEQIKYLFDNGFLSAVSVGFIPKERNGNVITKAELLEVSFVPVPANPEALGLAVASGANLSLVMKDIEGAIKGAVSDELDAEEAMEQKWEKMNQVWDAFSALCTVYFDENSAVESFGKLLTETIGILQKVVESGGVDDETKAKQLEATKMIAGKLFERFEMKVGAKYSAETKKAIAKAMEHSKNSISVLEGLLNEEANSTNDGKGLNADERSVNGEQRAISPEQMAELRDSLRITNSSAQKASRIFKLLEAFVEK